MAASGRCEMEMNETEKEANSTMKSLRLADIEKMAANLVIQRTRMGDVVENCRTIGVDSKEKEKLEHLLRTRNELVSQILDEKKECDELMDRLHKIQGKNLELRMEKEKLVDQTQTLREEIHATLTSSKKDTPKLTKQNTSLIIHWRLVTTARNVFQSLIFGSRSNWAADDNIRKLVFELGVHSEFFNIS